MSVLTLPFSSAPSFTHTAGIRQLGSESVQFLNHRGGHLRENTTPTPLASEEVDCFDREILQDCRTLQSYGLEIPPIFTKLTFQNRDVCVCQLDLDGYHV